MSYNLISIEGPDCAGKSSVVKELGKQENYFTYKTPPNEFIEYKDYFDNTATIESRYLFYLSGLIESSKEIEHYLEEGNVVTDRYKLSTLLYHQEMLKNSGENLIKENSSLKEIMESFNIKNPDKTFLLIAEEKTLKERIRQRYHNKEKTTKDSDIELDDDFRKKILDRYINYQPEEYEVKKIDTTNRSVEQTVQEIQQDLEEL